MKSYILISAEGGAVDVLPEAGVVIMEDGTERPWTAEERRQVEKHLERQDLAAINRILGLWAHGASTFGGAHV